MTIDHVDRGDSAALTLPGVRLIKSEEQLRALGSDELLAIAVDFDDSDLVVVSMGEQPTGGYWCDVTAVQQVGNTLWVQATVNRPGEDEVVTQALTYPYCAAVIEKTAATRANLQPQSPRDEAASR